MMFIAFIEKGDQADVIEKILRHCKLWREPEERVPSDVNGKPEMVDFILKPEYIPMVSVLNRFLSIFPKKKQDIFLLISDISPLLSVRYYYHEYSSAIWRHLTN